MRKRRKTYTLRPVGAGGTEAPCEIGMGCAMELAERAGIAARGAVDFLGRRDARGAEGFRWAGLGD